MSYTYDEIAGMIDHSLLNPTLDRQALEDNPLAIPGMRF